MNNNNISNAMLEVWEWKEKAYKEVEHLSSKEAVKKRLSDSLETVRKLEFTVSDKFDKVNAVV